MKQIIIIFFLLTIGTHSTAQQNSQIYYAIDGSTHSSITKRDLHEKSIWKRMKSNLVLIRLREDIEKNENTYFLIENKITVLPELIASLRRIHDTLLERNNNTPYVAKNGEKFLTKDFSDFFSFLLEEYEYWQNMLKSLSQDKMKKVTLSQVEKEVENRSKLFVTTHDSKYEIFTKSIDQYLRREETKTKKEKQESSPNKYYAIDGSKWETEEKRDRQEEIIFQELQLNFEKLNLKKDYGNSKEIIEHLSSLKKVIKASRELYKEHEPEIIIYKKELLKRGIKLDSGYSKNGEYFLLGTYKVFFDYMVDFYMLIHDIMKSMTTQNPDKIAFYKMAEDFQKYENAEEESKVLILNVYTQIQKIEDGIEKIDAEAYIEKQSSQNSYYSIDGRLYKTKRGRDNREKMILEDIREVITNADHKMLQEEDREICMSILDIIEEIPSLLRELEPSIQKEEPEEKAYKALNKEIFNAPDSRDLINYIVQLYSIVNKVADDLTQKEELGQRINLDTYHDEIFGYNYSQLFARANVYLEKLKEILKDALEEYYLKQEKMN